MDIFDNELECYSADKIIMISEVKALELFGARPIRLFMVQSHLVVVALRGKLRPLLQKIPVNSSQSLGSGVEQIKRQRH